MDTKKINEERDNDPFIVQVDLEIEGLEPIKVVGCNSLENAIELYKDFQTQFKNVENARWIALSKLGKLGYEQQKLYDLKDEEEI